MRVNPPGRCRDYRSHVSISMRGIVARVLTMQEAWHYVLQSVTQCYRVLESQCGHSATAPSTSPGTIFISVLHVQVYCLCRLQPTDKRNSTLQRLWWSNEQCSDTGDESWRHYEALWHTASDPDHDRDTGWGGWGSFVCLHREDHGPGRDKNAKFYFPLPMSSNVPWLLGAAQRCLATSACVALQQARPAPAGGAAAAAAGGG